jgi:hypothetical protein
MDDPGRRFELDHATGRGGTVNFEQLRLQIHMRDLYDRLGARDAELIIVDAFLREQARHETMQADQAPAGQQSQSV